MLPMTTVTIATFTHPRISSGIRRVSDIGIGSLTTVMRAGITRDTNSAAGPASIGCMPARIHGRLGKAPIFRIMRRVPRFPNNKVDTFVSCVGAGVHCPTSTGRGNARKHIAIRFIISGSNDVGRPGLLHSMSGSVGTRTLHLVDDVPG